MKIDYIIYTDGGCIYNPGGKGGYGALIIDPDTGEFVKLNGAFDNTTNNRMEVMAAIKALEQIPIGRSALLYSDSKYLVETANGIYSKNKNLDLWHRLDEARYVPDQKYVTACIRWYARGMDLMDCIRKILVDMEVSDKCRR